VGEGQKNGVYWALDRATLQPVWHTTVGPGSAAGGVIGSTAFDGSRIYGPNTLGAEVWALDHAGALAWVSKAPGPIGFSPVTLSNGVLYQTDSSSVLTARDAATGVPLAGLPLGAPSFAGVTVVGGAVYAGVGTGSSSSGSVVAFGDTSR
jgi:polyvinyl alcohol dehydrogenase (cytochrome)